MELGDPFRRDALKYPQPAPGEVQAHQRRRAGVILTVNAGSSSLKFALFGDGLSLVAKGQTAHWRAARFDEDGASRGDAAAGSGRETWRWIEPRLAGIGHRIVHGGTRYVAPVRVDDRVLA